MEARNAGFSRSTRTKKIHFCPKKALFGLKNGFIRRIHSIGKFILVHKKIFSARNVVWVTMTAVFAIKSIYLPKENCIGLKVYLVQESFICCKKNGSKKAILCPRKLYRMTESLFGQESFLGILVQKSFS